VEDVAPLALWIAKELLSVAVGYLLGHEGARGYGFTQGAIVFGRARPDAVPTWICGSSIKSRGCGSVRPRCRVSWQPAHGRSTYTSRARRRGAVHRTDTE
jgi:hypothetical protein